MFAVGFDIQVMFDKSNQTDGDIAKTRPNAVPGGFSSTKKRYFPVFGCNEK
jgi:hypothetical protein